jgi:hypothetical protein
VDYLDFRDFLSTGALGAVLAGTPMDAPDLNCNSFIAYFAIRNEMYTGIYSPLQVQGWKLAKIVSMGEVCPVYTIQ